MEMKHVKITPANTGSAPGGVMLRQAQYDVCNPIAVGIAALRFCPRSMQVYSFVLQNPPHRQSENRYQQ
jgi:hypothetical protein